MADLRCFAWAIPGQDRFVVSGHTYTRRGVLSDPAIGDGWFDKPSKTWRDVTAEGVIHAGAERLFVVQSTGFCHLPPSEMVVGHEAMRSRRVATACPACEREGHATIEHVKGPAVYGGGFTLVRPSHPDFEVVQGIQKWE